MFVIDAKKVARICGDIDKLLVDIRSSSTRVHGVPQDAVLWSEQQLIDQAKSLKEQGKTIYIMCYRGQTSLALATQLSQQFSGGFYSIEGGFDAWKSLDLPTVIPPKDSDLKLARYERQIKSAGFGEASQYKLLNAHVLVVGAGGLGAPALLYLAGAGVGRITLMDDDKVELHNLHRQIIYQHVDVGQSKSVAAEKRLKALNNSIEVTALNERLTDENVENIISAVDLVIDGSDNVATRYTINDACLKLGIPWVFAAVSGFNVQLAVFSGDKMKPCYRCLFPSMDDDFIGGCENEGILGFVPGVAALLQVTEAIKYLTGMDNDLVQGMLHYDLLRHHLKVLKYPPQVNSKCQH